MHQVARWLGEKQLKQRPRRSAGTGRRSRAFFLRRAERDSTFCHPSGSGRPLAEGLADARRRTILGGGLVDAGSGTGGVEVFADSAVATTTSL